MTDGSITEVKSMRWSTSTLAQVCIGVSIPPFNVGICVHLQPDLTPLFNWNTKQLFLYLEAEYENTQGVSPKVMCYEYLQ